MRRALIIASAFLSTACGMGDPEDPFFVLGNAEDGSGQRLIGAPLELLRGAGQDCSFGIPRHEVVGPAGPPPAYEQVQETLAGDEGRFLFQLRRYQIVTNDLSFSYYPCFRVDLAGSPSGAKSSVWLMIPNADVYIDRMYRWDEGAIAAEPTADGLLLSTPPGPLPATEILEPNLDSDLVAYEWELTASGETLWRGEKTSAPLVLDALLREDFPDIEARANLLTVVTPGKVERNPFSAAVGYSMLASGPPAFFSGAASGVPVSRGAPCSAGALRFDPCAATDGKLEMARIDFSTGDARALTLELPRPAIPSAAIVRGLFNTTAVLIEGSADGVNWSPLGSVQPSDPRTGLPSTIYAGITGGPNSTRYYRVPLAPSDTPVTQIRLGGNFSSLVAREVSIFE